MKFYFTFLLLCIGYLSASSQKTISNNKQWNIVDYKVFTPNICTGLYSFQNDTIINSKEYLQLFVTGDTLNNSNWNPLNTFLREDSLSRIYLYENEVETILYDFNLMSGDTFQLTSNSLDCELIVYSVDSIQLLNGETRKRIRLIASNDPDPNQPWYGYKDWVQGIGSTTSLTRYYESCYTDYPYDLLCYYENDILVYTKPNNQGCYLTPTDDIIESEQIVLFPNPTSRTIEVKMDEMLLDIKIFNFSGQLVMKSSGNTINVEPLEPGMYFMQIETKKGKSVKRFVVE